MNNSLAQCVKIVLMLGVFLIATSCVIIGKQKPVVPRSMLDVGEVHVTAFPSIPLENVLEDLKFKLEKDSEELLKWVLPTTSESIRSSSRNISLNITAGPPKDDEGNNPEIGKTNPHPTTKDIGESGFVGNISKDPKAVLRALASLQQEIVLLSHYLDEVGTDEDKIPYLLNLQVTIVPKSRRQPIDTYIDFKVVGDKAECEECKKSKFTLSPMIISDNIERSNSIDVENIVTSIQAKFLETSGSFGGAGLGSVLDNLNSFRGNNYNALQSLYQPNSETITLKIGAAFSPSSKFEMRNQTYWLSFVVFVDRDEWDSVEAGKKSYEKDLPVVIKAYPRFKHSETGVDIPRYQQSDMDNLAARFIEYLEAPRIYQDEDKFYECIDSDDLIGCNTTTDWDGKDKDHLDKIRYDLSTSDFWSASKIVNDVDDYLDKRRGKGRESTDHKSFTKQDLPKLVNLLYGIEIKTVFRNSREVPPKQKAIYMIENDSFATVNLSCFRSCFSPDYQAKICKKGSKDDGECFMHRKLWVKNNLMSITFPSAAFLKGSENNKDIELTVFTSDNKEDYTLVEQPASNPVSSKKKESE